MKNFKNIGTVDRVVRVAVGAAMLLFVPLALVGSGVGWALFGLFGVIPLFAGALGYCPPYALLGINTYRGNGKQRGEKHNPFGDSACC